LNLDIDVKLCECGCGQPAAIAGSTDRGRGYIKGQPTRFARGHRGGSRGSRQPTRAGHKVCLECGEEKPLDAFPQDPARADQRHTYCRPCKARLMREANRRYKQRYPARTRRREREAYLRKQYGMTGEDYNRLLMSQGGRCAICGTSEPPRLTNASSSGLSFSIDHDHETGAVRGWPRSGPSSEPAR
jgi:hypothetical protein